MGEDSQAIAAFRRDLDLRLPVVLDEAGDVSRSYGLRAVPATFLIDEGGILRQQRLGPLVTGEVDTAWSRAWLAAQVQGLLEDARSTPAAHATLP